MKRQALYSSAKQTPGPGQDATAPAAASGPALTPSPSPDTIPGLQRIRGFGTRHTRELQFLGAAAFAAVLAIGTYAWIKPAAPALNPVEIDAAVTRALQKKTMPSRAAKAAELVRPAVVRVTGFNDA
jgi:serine protease DegQ